MNFNVFLEWSVGFPCETEHMDAAALYLIGIMGKMRFILPCPVNWTWDEHGDLCLALFNYWNVTNVESYQAKPSLFRLYCFVATSVTSSRYLLFLRKERKWGSICFYSICPENALEWKRMNACDLMHQTTFKSKAGFVSSVFNARLSFDLCQCCLIVIY